ncbi:MAG: opine oxidase subunit [Gammaproteobacteria bacterium]|nr:opine oxidase subunit [Gammaproteobacteria bacterium]
MQKNNDGNTADIVVIGAGVVGAAIAYGLAGGNSNVLVLDGGDRDLRASYANVGLVWLQGKGMDMPAYQMLTRDSIERWATFSAEIEDTTGIDLQYERSGGLTYCLGEAEFEKWRATLLRLHHQLGSAQPDWELIDRSALAKLLPKAPPGPDVSGASFGRRDGQANPLRLLAALHAGILRKAGRLRRAGAVSSIRSHGSGGFTIDVGAEQVSAARVVIAAGLGSKALAVQVGLDVPIRPQRGQVLVTERLEPILPMPLHGVRQTQEGTVMIGSTQEEVGFDLSTTNSAGAAMSAKAIRWIPALRDVTLVRQWAGLRIMTPDRHPVYAESQSHPGVFVAVCHSGVTLAAAHASLLADAIAAGRLSPSLEVFHPRRFDVPKAA